MLHLLKKPTGIDWYIQAAQVRLWSTLSAKWGVSGLPESQFEFYGRTYKNFRKDGFEPNAFLSDTEKEYKEVYIDDGIAATMFFSVGDPDRVENMVHRYKVSLYGFLNLNWIVPNDYGQRQDMQIVQQVVNAIDTIFGFQVTGVVMNVDKVMSEYTGSKIRDAVRIFNMQPYLCFRIDMENLIQLNLNLQACAPSFVYNPNYNMIVCSIRCEFVDSPDSTFTQLLCNENRIVLQYQANTNTVTVPHLIGLLPLTIMYYNYAPVEFGFDSETGTITNPNGNFNAGDLLVIQYNQNN